MTPRKPFVLVIGGPTASGKSCLSLALASLLPVQVINFDSMQIYRGMDIGTAKATAEEQDKVPHHLLDLCDPDEHFSVGRYIPLFRKAVKEITEQGDLPVAVGGTGLYLRAALGGLFEGPERDDALRAGLRDLENDEPGVLFRVLMEKDPETASKTRPSDLVRVIRALEVHTLTGSPISRLQAEHAFADRACDARIYCLNPDRKKLYGWIAMRVDRMMENGLLAEVKALRDKGYGRNLASMKGLGYRELMAHLDGEASLEEAVELIKRNTRRFAKRQMTWFRGEENVNWVEYREREEISELAVRIAKDVQRLTKDSNFEFRISDFELT